MKRIQNPYRVAASIAALGLLLIAASHPVATAAPIEPVRQGHIDRSARTPKQRSSTVPRPTVTAALAETVRDQPSDTLVRVVVELAAPELARAARSASAPFEARLRRLDDDARAIRQRARLKVGGAEERDPALVRRLTGDDRAAMDRVNLDREDVAAAQHAAVTAAVRAVVRPIGDDLEHRIGALGGSVVHRFETAPVVLASVPAGRVHQLAAMPDVLQVSLPGTATADLDIQAQAIRIDDGPWSGGDTGGIWDPAVLDTGTAFDHPALEDGSGRTNFSSYYLVDAAYDPCYDDHFAPDDYYGHGTHVLGIVASRGTPDWPDLLGMAHGVDKAVTLKAGFKCTNGRAKMKRTDAMALVDRALARPEDLAPAGTFNDDVDGINLSFGSTPSEDDSSWSRFFDSAVAMFDDTPITVAAGNTGPGASTVEQPSTAYNVISVANVDDHDTATRTDDAIWGTSSRGPTLAGRRKPDLAAPGTGILSANFDWENGSDFINMTGTSMAAPAVLGAIMTLMDGGQTDELALKAILINHARKNDAAIDFDDADADGWDPAYGWGYVNLQQSYFHIDDVFLGSVTEAGQPGDVRLYSGQMSDSPFEGRDRVTLVWNREAVYVPAGYPTVAHDLVDLDLRLYDADSLSLIDSDTTDIDNVHQVRRDPDSSGPVIVKVSAEDADFAHGGDTQAYALATEEGFTEVPYPDAFTLDVTAPASVPAGQEFDVHVTLTNDSQLTTSGNGLILTVPPGLTLVSGGTSVFASGPMEPGETGIDHTWRFTATAPATLTITHAHSSFGELWSEQYAVQVAIGDGGGEIFADGFESGDLGEWSSTAP